MAAEHVFKAYLVSMGRDVKLRSLIEVAQDLRELGLLDDEEFTAISELNSLRNKVYHEGLLPRRADIACTVPRVKSTVERFLRLVR